MYISELEKRSGVTARALRLYEALGLLSVARRGKYRWYEHAHIEFVQLIKWAQGLGVTLAELQQLKVADNDLDWSALNQLLIDKRQRVINEKCRLERQLKDIDHYRDVISDCVERGLNRCAV